MTEEERRYREAIALSYEKGDDVPKVVATGRGYMADKIVQRAQESNVPIHQDEKVADALSKVELGQYIPKELYEVVAEILVFVGDMDKVREKMK